MPVILCNTKNTCGFDNSNPLSNLSAEAPDVDVFFGIDYDQRTDPPLGSSWTTKGCVSPCLSTISQADADLCAARQAVLCNQGDWRWPAIDGQCPEGSIYDPTLNACVLPIFFNTSQTCFSYCPDGQAFAFTQSFPAFAGNNQALVNAMALSYACNQAAQRRVCLSNLSPSEACMDSPYYGEVAVSGNAPATMTIIAGGLPPGITANQANNTSPLVLSGTPTSSGLYSFTVRAQTAELDLMDKAYTISVVTILNSALTEAPIDEPYSFSLTIGGTPTGQVQWSLISGTLPPGIFLNFSTGELFGTPTAAGDYAFRIGFSDSGVTLCAKDLTLTVSDDNLFEDLVWVEQFITQDGGTASGTFLEENFTASATSTGSWFQPGGNINYAGTLTYTGVAINCEIEITAFSATSSGVPQPQFVVTVTSDIDGSLLNEVITAIGTYPFLIPASAGAIITVTIDVLATNGTEFDTANQTISVTGAVNGPL